MSQRKGLRLRLLRLALRYLLRSRSAIPSWKTRLRLRRLTQSHTRLPSSLPYRLLDGTTVANNWSDLVDGTLAHPIDIDETGASRVVAGGTQVWTGTDIAGGAFWGLSCSVWTNATSSGDQAFAGINNTTDLNWTMNQVLTCDQKSLHLYCLEQGAAPSNPAPAT